MFRSLLISFLMVSTSWAQNAHEPQLISGPSTPSTIAVAPSICDGVTDSRSALQAILTASAGKAVLLPDGTTCLITPLADKSAFLTLPAGTILRGNATLKVANGSAPYGYVLFGEHCTGCQISDITIDANVAGNPLVSQADLLLPKHARQELWVGGADISIDHITIKNTSSVNSIVSGIGSSRIAVRNSTFSNVGDDPNHVVHDLSVLYLHGSQVTVIGNHFTGISRGAPAAVTAIETHATGQIIANNTIANFGVGINWTGWDTVDSEASQITGNSISGALFGIDLWSHTYSGHTSGFGINGLTVAGNSIRINQTSYRGANTGGIVFDNGNNLPVRNVVISGNTVVFDREESVRTGSVASIGIGVYEVATATYSNIVVANNLIDNAPVAGIRFAVPLIDGLVVKNNVIRDAGSSLDSAVNANYKMPIWVMASAGAVNGEISSNTIIDDFAASRITYPFILGSTAASSLTMLWNTISITDATAASWQSYMGGIQDNNIKPLFRHIATGKPWTTPARFMRNGSQVYDTTTATQYNLLADGTGWFTGVSSTNPGCTASHDVGKLWFDTTSGANTVYKVCLMVGGMPIWVTK
jgi:hypothetical protein